MRFTLFAFIVVLAISTISRGADETVSTELTPVKSVAKESAPLGPAPTKDRVGFPKGYAEDYVVLRAIYKPKWNEILTVYGNRQAATISKLSELPYPYGSIIVMEKAKAVTDADGNAILDSKSGLRKAKVIGIDVMKRQPGFGAEYGDNRTGEWEYVKYLSDGSYDTPPSKSAICAECHKKAGAKRDWVFHGRFFDGP